MARFNALDEIERRESGGRNVYQQVTDPKVSTAQGYFQITNSTWRDTAPDAGVDLSKYPTAMAAPYAVQRKVAGELYSQRGIQPWEAMKGANPALYGSDAEIPSARGNGSVAEMPNTMTPARLTSGAMGPITPVTGGSPTTPASQDPGYTTPHAGAISSTTPSARMPVDIGSYNSPMATGAMGTNGVLARAFDGSIPGGQVAHDSVSGMQNPAELRSAMLDPNSVLDTSAPLAGRPLPWLATKLNPAATTAMGSATTPQATPALLSPGTATQAPAAGSPMSPVPTDQQTQPVPAVGAMAAGATPTLAASGLAGLLGFGSGSGGSGGGGLGKALGLLSSGQARYSSAPMQFAPAADAHSPDLSLLSLLKRTRIS